MQKISAKMTVYFEKPFWVGVFERKCGDIYEVSKVTFGAEPKDYEVWELVIKNFHRLKFSKSTEESAVEDKRINPKRLQREISRQIHNNVSVCTKAQQALKSMQEQNKLQRKISSRLKREEEKKRKYNLRQNKRKQKHRGR